LFGMWHPFERGTATFFAGVTVPRKR